jgi:hypothetical protein
MRLTYHVRSVKSAFALRDTNRRGTLDSQLAHALKVGGTPFFPQRLGIVKEPDVPPFERHLLLPNRQRRTQVRLVNPLSRFHDIEIPAHLGHRPKRSYPLQIW